MKAKNYITRLVNLYVLQLSSYREQVKRLMMRRGKSGLNKENPCVSVPIYRHITCLRPPKEDLNNAFAHPLLPYEAPSIYLPIID
jgi:hypothetical protein